MELEGLIVTDSDTVAVADLDAVILRDWVMEEDIDGVRDRLPVCVSDRVGVLDLELDTDTEMLIEREGEPDLDCDSEGVCVTDLLPVCVSEGVGVNDWDSVGEGVVLDVREGVLVPDPVPVCV